MSVVLLAALLALALSGCANRYEPGSTTALAIEAMALAAQVQDANADRNSPVGGHAARATAYMNTGEGGGGTEESAGGLAPRPPHRKPLTRLGKARRRANSRLYARK